MYVCICYGLTEDDVATAIAGGAADEDAVAAACGAGSDCGTCREIIADLVDDAQCGRLCARRASGVTAA